MLPSGFLNRITPAPLVEVLTYPARDGQREGDLYRPATRGPHPAMVVCLGVIPVDVEHPQVARLGEALARSGFAALLYWSPAMRDLRLAVEDVENLALAFDALVAHPDVDASRSGIFGTCVGGSFALMAAAQPLVRDRVRFVGAFAPYSRLQTFARDIASATREDHDNRIDWPVDQLTRKVFVRTMTAHLDPADAELLREAMAERDGSIEPGMLSDEGQIIHPLLASLTVAQAIEVLDSLPATLKDQMAAMSPGGCLQDIHAPKIVIMHDRDDHVIPVGESRHLARSLSGRAGVHYTEFSMFKHADPTQKKLNPVRLMLELVKFYRSVLPLFR